MHLSSGQCSATKNLSMATETSQNSLGPSVLPLAISTSNYPNLHSPGEVAQHPSEIMNMRSCVHVGLPLPVYSARRRGFLKWCSILFTNLRPY